MKKIVYIILGSVFVGIGVIGIFVPGLPTTLFLLLASYFYVRSSPRLHSWLINHKVLGKFIRDFQKHRAMSVKHKIISITSMWLFISASVIFFIENIYVSAIVLLCGLIGTVVILSVKTLIYQDAVKELNDL